MDRPQVSKTNPLAFTHTRGPLNPRTWSGTSLNLANALRRADCDVRGIDSGIKSRALKYAFAIQSVLRGYGPLYFRAREARQFSARIVQQQAKTHGCRNVLHCGTLDLPMAKPDRSITHYMYTDSTWDMWYKDSRFRFLTQKLIKHAEDLDREAYAQLEHIFLISEFARQRFIDRYHIPAERITVVGAGRSPDIEPFRGEKDYRNGPILFIAKHRFEEKGGHLLLDAFRIAQEKRRDLKLVILGSPDLKKLAAGAKNVQVLGHIPFQQLQNLFNDASLLAMPALMEPWGLVYLEALACKTPILGLNRMAFPEISGHGKYGFIVNEPTPESVAAGILDALSDADRLQRMGAEGQAYCLSKFTWENTANAIASRIFEPASTAMESSIH